MLSSCTKKSDISQADLKKKIESNDVMLVHFTKVSLSVYYNLVCNSHVFLVPFRNLLFIIAVENCLDKEVKIKILEKINL